MNILIADDNPVALKVLESFLLRKGHAPLCAFDGNDAWELYLKEKPQVLISDWMMPGMDGIEICKRLRERPADHYTYVILLTIKDGKRNFLEALDAGADDFMTKPFDTDEMAARLHVAERIVNLQHKVRTYEKILPICMYCKKIRNDEDQNWQAIDRYLEDLTEQHLSHGVCPDCYEREMQRMGLSKGRIAVG